MTYPQRSGRIRCQPPRATVSGATITIAPKLRASSMATGPGRSLPSLTSTSITAVAASATQNSTAPRTTIWLLSC